jgi:toxin ParE1/3/4
MANPNAAQLGRQRLVNLLWTRLASWDRKTIREYIAVDNPAAALTMDELFEKKAGLLLVQPAIGRPGRITGTREWLVHQNYLLIYDVQGESLRILRVLHTARAWPQA